MTGLELDTDRTVQITVLGFCQKTSLWNVPHGYYPLIVRQRDGVRFYGIVWDASKIHDHDRFYAYPHPPGVAGEHIEVGGLEMLTVTPYKRPT